MPAPVWESVATASGATSGGVAQIVCNKPSGVVEGDLMVAVWAWQNGTPTAPSGWTQVFIVSGDGSSSSIVGVVFWKVAGSSEPSSYTFTNSLASTGRSGTLSIHRITGANTTAPVDVYGTTLFPDADHFSLAAPSITTTEDDTLLLAGITYNVEHEDGSLTPPTGYTERVDFLPPSGSILAGQTVATKTQATAGATGTATFTPNEGFREQKVSFHIAIAPVVATPVTVNVGQATESDSAQAVTASIVIVPPDVPTLVAPLDEATVSDPQTHEWTYTHPSSVDQAGYRFRRRRTDL